MGRAIPGFGQLSTILLWIMLALPAWPLLSDFWYSERYYPELMHDSGIFSVQLLVASLLVTPLSYLLRRQQSVYVILAWVRKRRRNLGVASFAYAGIHLAFYLRETGSINLVWLEAMDFELLIGWLAFFVFVLLAITSNDFSVHRMLRNWKRLHWWVYPATFLTFLHWFLFDSFVNDVAFWAGILALGWVVRLTLRLKSSHMRQAA